MRIVIKTESRMWILSLENQNLDAEWEESGMTVLFKYFKDQGMKERFDLHWMYSSSGQKCANGSRLLGGGFQLNIKCFSENQNCSLLEGATGNFRRGRMSFDQRQFFIG